MLRSLRIKSSDDEYSELNAFLDMMNENISDGRIVEIE